MERVIPEFGTVGMGTLSVAQIPSQRTPGGCEPAERREDRGEQTYVIHDCLIHMLYVREMLRAAPLLLYPVPILSG